MTPDSKSITITILQTKVDMSMIDALALNESKSAIKEVKTK